MSQQCFLTSHEWKTSRHTCGDGWCSSCQSRALLHLLSHQSSCSGISSRWTRIIIDWAVCLPIVGIRYVQCRVTDSNAPFPKVRRIPLLVSHCMYIQRLVTVLDDLNCCTRDPNRKWGRAKQHVLHGHRLLCYMLPKPAPRRLSPLHLEDIASLPSRRYETSLDSELP